MSVVRQAGDTPDAELTRRLQIKLQPLEILFWPARTNLAVRQSNSYVFDRLNALSRVMLGHTVRWVWSKVQVLQLGE
jgi:hypothetical protein